MTWMLLLLLPIDCAAVLVAGGVIKRSVTLAGSLPDSRLLGIAHGLNLMVVVEHYM